MPPTEGEDEVKEGKRLTLNKPLIRLPVLLVQVKAAKILIKIVKKKVYLLYQYNKITKNFTTI